MKSKLLACLFSVLHCLLVSGASEPAITHVHPTCWWAGMHNPELQVMLHGSDIGKFDVELKGADGLVIKDVIRPTNSNYLFLYLDTKDAQPQNFKILLKEGKKVMLSIPFELRQREDRRLGTFTSEDVVYLLMPDRFATGTTDKQKQKMYAEMKENTWGTGDFDRHGGDLAGMTQHLEYLQDLGVTAIWPTPTLENNQRRGTYHGYAITDYYRTDPRLGTNEDYRHFVDEAHRRGMKVIKDIVFNHCGSDNFLFADRPSDDWFSFDSKFTGTTYHTGAVSDPHASAQDFIRYQQALTILLTMRGIPQLYYGDEIGMFASKRQGDGALRQNFPGGWPSDARNAFTAEGRSELQRQYFNFTRKLLNWRKRNKAITHGKLIHFNVNNGVYVYARQFEDKVVAVIVNGSNKEQVLPLKAYTEVLPGIQAMDIISEQTVQLAESVTMAPRQIMLLEF